MNATRFLSKATYVVLPTKSNPKVFLNIGTAKMAQRAFDLYNPFSNKGKILKKSIRFLCVYCNPLARRLLPIHKSKKSKLIKRLEESFQEKLWSSVYLATDSQKVVLQLQNTDGILGYLKYAKTGLGIQRVLNEEKAIGVFSRLDLGPKLIYSGNYKKRPFLVINSLTGTISLADREDYRIVLEKLKKNKRFRLANHPRILEIKRKLMIYGFDKLNMLLDKACNLSNKTYNEVYEHGDFAPWNLIKTEQGLMPFDFEYFEEFGLEYLDEIKYHFQIERLLKHKKGAILIKDVENQIPMEDFSVMFQVFLIKEIINKYEAKNNYDFEYSLLKILGIEEA